MGLILTLDPAEDSSQQSWIASSTCIFALLVSGGTGKHIFRLFRGNFLLFQEFALEMDIGKDIFSGWVMLVQAVLEP